MTNTIKLDHKIHYGKEYYYPLNDSANHLVQLANRKAALTKTDLSNLANFLDSLGLSIELDIQCHPSNYERAYDL